MPVMELMFISFVSIRFVCEIDWDEDQSGMTFSPNCNTLLYSGYTTGWRDLSGMCANCVTSLTRVFTPPAPSHGVTPSGLFYLHMNGCSLALGVDNT